ncbi:hypothetical protein A9Q89_12805 [Gammaproteobacteria bacterium 53_120_T64]|nr:hypothetical protein A9Q89_12805 [Gammaproteobacteria bacterium 53_120_T64]
MLVLLGAYFLCANLAFGAGVLAQDSRFKLLRLGDDTSAEQLAVEHLADRFDAWQISQLNGRSAFRAGEIVSIPRSPLNPAAIYNHSARLIPILCYHQFSQGSEAKRRLEVSAENFERQMRFLSEAGYQVIPLRKMRAILQGDSAIPPKAVVLTIDDGYRSVYTYAYPILKKYGFTATLFVYTDFIGGSAALSWQQIKTMRDSGVIDVESHTKTHSSLSFDTQGESLVEHRQRIAVEIDASARTLKKHLGQVPTLLAYPYGDSSRHVVEHMLKSNYQLAVTVKRGANTAYADPLLLQRTMIYNNHTLRQFKKFLSTSRAR